MRWDVNFSFNKLFSFGGGGADILNVRAGSIFNVKPIHATTPVSVKVIEQRPSIRNSAFAVFKHSIITAVEANGETLLGVGEDNDPQLARKKSIFEAIERVIFKSVANKGFKPTSNGWAAHINTELCRENAMFELIERDACMKLFHSQSDLHFVSSESLPEYLQIWIKNLVAKTTFKKVEFAIIDCGFSLVAATLLLDEDGYGVFGFASGTSFEKSIYKSLSEAARMAETALSKVFYLSSKRLAEEGFSSCPQDHAVYYAHHEKIPRWLFKSRKSSWKNLESEWKNQNFNSVFDEVNPDFKVHLDDGLIVGSCTSEKIQKLYFGNHKDALKNNLINKKRLENKLNLMQPHFVS